MAARWHEIVDKNLESGDELQKTYPGKLDGKNGHLCLSKRKLLFVHESGFMRKSYDLTLDLPYENIGEISRKGRYELDLTDVEGKRRDFRAGEIPASIIEKSIEELIK